MKCSIQCFAIFSKSSLDEPPHARAPIGSHSGRMIGSWPSTPLTSLLRNLGSTTAWYTNSSILTEIISRELVHDTNQIDGGGG